jgi:hypothetical protein
MEAISNGVVETVFDVERFIRCTLFAAQTYVAKFILLTI